METGIESSASRFTRQTSKKPAGLERIGKPDKIPMEYFLPHLPFGQGDRKALKRSTLRHPDCFPGEEVRAELEFLRFATGLAYGYFISNSSDSS